MAGWTRVLAALPLSFGCMLHLGCRIGFTTRMLLRRGYEAAGVDSSAGYILRAR
jgi:hypothetical protein